MPLGIEVLIVLGVLALASTSRLGRRTFRLTGQWLGRLREREQDPVEALDLAYQKQLQAMQQVRRGYAEVVTSEHRLERHFTRLRTDEERLRGQAREAVLEGRDEFARLALRQAHEANAELKVLELQIRQLRLEEEKVQLTAQRLQGRIQTLRTQRDTLKAQYSAAQAAARVGEVATGIAPDVRGVQLALERAEEQTSEMRAMAAALDQLVASGALAAPGSEDAVEQELRTAAARAELDRLHQDLQRAPSGVQGGSAELGQSASVREG